MVEVVSTKWNGDFHRRTPSRELGSDQSGTWLWMPPGTVAETPTGPFDATPGLRLLPVGQWWSAYFVPSSPPSSRPASIYVDICTPIRRHGDRFEFVDLDLDVEQVDGSPAVILDEDEFDDRRQRWTYPADLVASAEAACIRVMESINERHRPFDGSYLEWWSRV